MRTTMLCLLMILPLALVADEGADGDGKTQGPDYTKERCQIEVPCEGLDDGLRKDFGAHLKRKFKGRATAGFIAGDVLIKCQHQKSVRYSDVAKAVAEYAKRKSTRKAKVELTLYLDDAELRGKVDLALDRQLAKQLGDDKKHNALVDALNALDGVTVLSSIDPRKPVLTLIVSDPGSTVGAVAGVVDRVLEIERGEDAPGPVTDVTWHGPDTRDPRIRRVRLGGGGACHR